jgi:hypothetical protein
MIDKDHLEEVNSTYIEHFIYAGKFTLLTLLAFFLALIHTFIPWLFPYSAFNIQKKIIKDAEEIFTRTR